MKTGVVKWFNDQKGFGFIVPNEPSDREQGKDLFVHQRSIVCDGFRTLVDGQKVSFDIAINEADGRRQAVNVRPLE